MSKGKQDADQYYDDNNYYENNDPSEWSSDSGDEGLGYVTIERGYYSYYGGNKKTNHFYDPSSVCTRPKTSLAEGQGDHVIPFSFLTYAILSFLDNKPMKKLDLETRNLLSAIIPYGVNNEDINNILNSVDVLSERFREYRKARKYSTASLRAINNPLVDEIKQTLINSESLRIREDIEGILSDVIEIVNKLPGSTFPKDRKKKRDKAIKIYVSDGNQIGAALRALIELDYFLNLGRHITSEELKLDGTSGKNRGTQLAKFVLKDNKIEGKRGKKVDYRKDLSEELVVLLNDLKDNLKLDSETFRDEIIYSMSAFIDYVRTNTIDNVNEGQDNFNVLCDSLARTSVLIFNCFSGLLKFEDRDIEDLYTNFIALVLEEQGWVNTKKKNNHKYPDQFQVQIQETGVVEDLQTSHVLQTISFYVDQGMYHISDARIKALLCFTDPVAMQVAPRTSKVI